MATIRPKSVAAALRAGTGSPSHEDGVLDHDNESCVSYVTDIEGNWEYFCAFIRLSPALEFVEGPDVYDAHGAADIELTPGWHFIHGGDSCDKGGAVGGSIRVVRTLVRLKRKYPERVHLLIGNRDANKVPRAKLSTAAALRRTARGSRVLSPRPHRCE